MPSSDKSQARVHNSALFRGLSSDDLTQVLSQGFVREAPRGTFLFRQGEPATNVLLLESGRVRLNEVAAGGRELLVRFVIPGEVFGDRAAIPGSKYGGTAVSDGQVRVWGWPTATMARLLQDVPRLSTNLLATTTGYLHYARKRYRILATDSAEQRIRWALAELARSFGLQQRNGTEITGRALQSDIADLAVTDIYTVSRVLGRYEQSGLLKRKRGQIVLLPAFQ